jgi:hypothetical protein
MERSIYYTPEIHEGTFEFSLNYAIRCTLRCTSANINVIELAAGARF